MSGDSLRTRLTALQGSNHYGTFLKELMKRLLTSANSEDCQSLAKTLNVITNEKIQQEKRPKKKKSAFFPHPRALHHVCP